MKLNSKDVFAATGRRKTSSARVHIARGTGKWTINGRALNAYFPVPHLEYVVKAPLMNVDLLDAVDIHVKVTGSGISGQAGAVSHGIARALEKMDPELRAPLKSGGFLTRDSRMKERNKPGQPKARKRFQFSKR